MTKLLVFISYFNQTLARFLLTKMMLLNRNVHIWGYHLKEKKNSKAFLVYYQKGYYVYWFDNAKDAKEFASSNNIKWSGN